MRRQHCVGVSRPTSHVQDCSGRPSATVLSHEVYEIVHLHAGEEIDRRARKADSSIDSIIVIATVRIELGIGRIHGITTGSTRGSRLIRLRPNTPPAVVPRRGMQRTTSLASPPALRLDG